MADRATVVLNLCGPYTIRGRPVIAACVDAGAHYVDLTGEIPFVCEVLDEFDGPGCLTPALAVGTSHLERFRRARMRFSVS